MKAFITPKYGSPDVLQLKEVKKPHPKEFEVLIKIHATSVNLGDCELRSFSFPSPPIFRFLLRAMFGIFKPRKPIQGMLLAGVVEAVGKNVTLFQKGDNVFGTTSLKLGAFAEYVCLPEKYPLVTKPENLSFAEVTPLLMAMEGLHFLRRGDVKKGDKVLINGAGGSIGTYAVQIAKHFEAEVTAVDCAEKLEILSSIGADFVIDYLSEDFTENGKKYDVIFDVIGLSSFNKSLKSLKPNGRYLLANIRKMSTVFKGIWVSRFTDKKVVMALADYKIEDLKFLKQLAESGRVKSVIDKIYLFEKLAEAHRYVETGRKKGNVIITIN